MSTLRTLKKKAFGIKNSKQRDRFLHGIGCKTLGDLHFKVVKPYKRKRRKKVKRKIKVDG